VPVQVGPEVVGTLSADLPCSGADLLEACREFLSAVASLIANDVKARREAQQQREMLEEENRRLRGQLEGIRGPKNIVGTSRAMREVYLRISQVAASNATVMIRGESGTGKELVAAALHYTSPRAKAAFVRVNCAALSETLIESELFGHEKGAFTGALQSRPGRLEQAEGGTLFLDEIGDFSPAVQVKLLRVLQERQYERVGSNDTRQADVRILVATHRNLEADVESGRFRQDLYYRINVFPIFLPPFPRPGRKGRAERLSQEAVTRRHSPTCTTPFLTLRRGQRQALAEGQVIHTEYEGQPNREVEKADDCGTLLCCPVMPCPPQF
jgi:Nif-specific regulatory protein